MYLSKSYMMKKLKIKTMHLFNLTLTNEYDQFGHKDVDDAADFFYAHLRTALQDTRRTLEPTVVVEHHATA